MDVNGDLCVANSIMVTTGNLKELSKALSNDTPYYIPFNHSTKRYKHQTTGRAISMTIR